MTESCQVPYGNAAFSRPVASVVPSTWVSPAAHDWSAAWVATTLAPASGRPPVPVTVIAAVFTATVPAVVAPGGVVERIVALTVGQYAPPELGS